MKNKPKKVSKSEAKKCASVVATYSKQETKKGIKSVKKGAKATKAAAIKLASKTNEVFKKLFKKK